MLLVDWLECLDVLELGKNIVNEIGFSDGKVVFTTLGALDGISIGKYGGTFLTPLEGSTELIS